MHRRVTCHDGPATHAALRARVCVVEHVCARASTQDPLCNTPPAGRPCGAPSRHRAPVRHCL
eukprot:7936461-Alexandrium_andersonii.AAC.1